MTDLPQKIEACDSGSLIRAARHPDPLEQTQLLVRDAKIMMVDDEELNMDVLKIHLEDEGYTRFVSVSNASLALVRIREEMPDVLLLDLVMPDVSGFDILTCIRNDEKLRYLPVLVLTSANDASTKLMALQLGATDFLAKPIDSSELALRVRNTLNAMAWRRRISEVDALTNIPNRAWFTQMLKNRMLNFDRERCSSAVFVININRFKSINDSLGPAFGDEVLKEFCQRLTQCFRDGKTQQWYSSERPCLESATIARLDGDRFGIHLPKLQESQWEQTIESKSESILDALEQPFFVADQLIYLSVTIGITNLRADMESVEVLISNAETAMNYARQNSKSDYAIYCDDMDVKARELLSLENGLRTAVDKGEIFLVYQPKVDVRTNRIHGAEALVRWMHPEFGLISPVNFIPLAENSGMIVSIGDWVLREACKTARCWQQAGFHEFKIAVNVSIRQLHEVSFVDNVRSALEVSGLSPDSLIVELTENMIMDNAEVNTLKLQGLKALGVQISVDDFGTGYSSLSYLQRFPLDQLKIDRSFIKEIHSGTTHTPIVKAVISLAHDLGLNVVAEGIETEAQLAHIRQLGCEEYQGFLCSKPLSATKFLSIMHSDAQRVA